MRDPLQKFDWLTLYERYDDMCKGFDSRHPLLSHLEPLPENDRDLYYQLVENFKKDRRLGGISFPTYRAMLYWKLYSSKSSLLNKESKRYIGKKRVKINRALDNLFKILPDNLEKDADDVIKLLRKRSEFAVYGMANGLPVKTTFLHFLYPETMPVFDQMVLRAVDDYKKGDNQRTSIFKRYVPHAWKLAERYSGDFPKGPETPVRFIDMALWVVRGTV